MSHSSADWLKKVTNRELVVKTVRRAKRVLKKLDFDTVVFTGVSGALLGPILAYEMNKELVVIRKSLEDTHSFFCAEGYKDSQKYIFVDGLFCKGNTMERVVRVMKKFSPGAALVDVYPYADGCTENRSKGLVGLENEIIQRALMNVNK